MLSTGQEIIGEMEAHVDSKIMMRDVLQVNYRALENQPMPMVSVSRYMPFAAEPIFEFQIRDVVNMCTPSKPMQEYYIHSLSHYRSTIDANVDKEMSSAARYMSNRDIPTAQENYDDMLKHITFKGLPN